MAVTDVVEFLPISEDAVEIWADKICSYKPLTMDLRKSYFKKIEQAGYDIISASKNMEDFYLKEPRSCVYIYQYFYLRQFFCMQGRR